MNTEGTPQSPEHLPSPEAGTIEQLQQDMTALQHRYRDTMAGKHLERLDAHLNEESIAPQYETALRELKSLLECEVIDEKAIQACTERVIRWVLLHQGKTSDPYSGYYQIEHSYPSLKYSPKRDKYFKESPDGRTTDARHFYKFDLIKELNLPQEERDRITGEVLSEIIDKFQSNYGNSFADVHDLYRLAQEVSYIGYHLPIETPSVLKPLQERFAKIAPYLLISDDIYFYERIGNALGVAPHSKIEQYVHPAIDMLLDDFSAYRTSHSDYMGLGTLDRLIELQEKYPIPVTPERQLKVLDVLYCAVGSGKKEVMERFKNVFQVNDEQIHVAAQQRANDDLRASLDTPHESISDIHVGNHHAISGMMQRHNISVDEIVPLAAQKNQLHDIIRHGEPSAMAAYHENLQKTKLRVYLPEIMEALVRDVLENPDRNLIQDYFQHCRQSEEFEKPFNEALHRIFSRGNQTKSLLDLTHPPDRNFFKWLFEQECRRGLKREMELFLESNGINAEHCLHVLTHCSATEKQRQEQPNEIPKRHLTPEVCMRMAANITDLEKMCPGAVSYFYNQRNITMFNRYPTELLRQVYEQETGLTADDQNEKKKKKNKTAQHMLVLFPQNDWNGAFENHKLMNNLSEQVEKNQYQMHIAESGTRQGCWRQLAKMHKLYGPLKLAVMGGHSNKEEIQFGPRPEDTISLKEIERAESTEDLSEEAKHKLERLQSFFDPEGMIVFKACSVGSEEGIAEKISRLLKRITIGTDKNSFLKEIRIDLAEVEFNNSEAKRFYPSKRAERRHRWKQWWKHLGK